MLVGQEPDDLPIGTYTIFQEEMEEYIESQMEIKKQATLEAIVEFWNSIN